MSRIAVEALTGDERAVFQRKTDSRANPAGTVPNSSIDMHPSTFG